MIRATAGEWRPHCADCLNRCKVRVADYGFDYEGPHGPVSRDDFCEESDCCAAEVVNGNPDCTGCDSMLYDEDPVFWKRGMILCEDCHSG